MEERVSIVPVYLDIVTNNQNSILTCVFLISTKISKITLTSYHMVCNPFFTTSLVLGKHIARHNLTYAVVVLCAQFSLHCVTTLFLLIGRYSLLCQEINREKNIIIGCPDRKDTKEERLKRFFIDIGCNISSKTGIFRGF